MQNLFLVCVGGKGLWIKMDFLINGMIAIQHITHFQVWQIVTWQSDKNACGRKFDLPWENQPQWTWKLRTFWSGFLSWDFCILHSKELARWPWWSFLNEHAAPSVPQGVGCLHLYWAPVGAEAVGLFFRCWEPANKPVLMPDEQTYGGRVISGLKGCPGGEQAGPRGRHFITSLSRGRSWASPV